MYARDDFVYWGFTSEGLSRLGRIVGLDELEVVDELEIDGHPRILAVSERPADRAQQSADARARGRAEQTIEVWPYITATDRSTVDKWLALRPGSRPKPECHRPAQVPSPAGRD